MLYIKNRKHSQKCLPFVGNLNSQIKLRLLFIFHRWHYARIYYRGQYVTSWGNWTNLITLVKEIYLNV